MLDPSQCLACDDPNRCAQEVAKITREPQKPCWCMTATFSQELIDRVPEEAKNKACICKK